MATEELGRTRKGRAARKQARASELWAEAEKWKKYARCVLCRRRFCVNNYSDRRVKVSHLKIAGKIVCPWCHGKDAKFLIQLMLIVEKVAKGDITTCYETKPEGCKCLMCVAERVLKAHAEAPTIR